MKNNHSIILIFLILLLLSCEKQKETKNYWEKCDYTTDANLSSLYFVNENYGFAGGGTGEPSSSLLIKTTDGGKTWKYIDFISEKYIKKILFISEKIGYVQTTMSLYKTLDGGLNWFEINLGKELETENIHDFSFADDDHGYAIVVKEIEENNHFKVISTEDGGNNWQIILSSYVPHLTSIQTIKTNSSVVFLNSINSLYKSTDSGKSWKKIYFTESSHSWYFYFMNEKNGCLMNLWDSLLITTENGEEFRGIVENSKVKWASKPIMINEKEGFLAIPEIYYFNAETKKIISIEKPDGSWGILDMVMFSTTSGYAITDHNIYKYTAD